MSSVVCMHPSSTHLNEQRSQHLYAFDHHQQMNLQNSNNKQRETTIGSPDILSNHLNEDENCQICGDLASGWHCG
jgi:hypothetical protein